MLRSILAISQGGPDAAMSFRLAARVAGLFGTAVDALHLLPGITTSMVMQGELIPAFTSTPEDDAARTEESERQYNALIAPLRGATYTAAEVPSLDAVVSQGRCADVIVVGRPGIDPENIEPVTVSTAIHETGRPVMIAPPDSGAGDFEHVMVAWNGSLQAARAVAQAEPLLIRARRITIVVVGRSPEEAGAPLLARNLARKGSEATIEAIDPGAVSARARGRALLTHVHGKKADMLVMGAYGRSQLLTFLGMGGATAKVISSCRVPLLVAH